MSKYLVKACLNCKHCITDKKTREKSCAADNYDTMKDWFYSSGRKKLADMTSDDDLHCFEGNKKYNETISNQSKLKDFMADLNSLLQ